MTREAKTEVKVKCNQEWQGTFAKVIPRRKEGLEVGIQNPNVVKETQQYTSS